VIDVLEGKPQFGEIVLILSVMNAIHMVMKCNKTTDFDEHYSQYTTEEIPL
jgi:hypothetical protein